MRHERTGIKETPPQPLNYTRSDHTRQYWQEALPPYDNFGVAPRPNAVDRVFPAYPHTMPDAAIQRLRMALNCKMP